jgi:uncharacterized membrane protein
MPMKGLLLIIMVAFYLFAGFYHFKNPGFYTPFFPPYLHKWAASLNILAGIAEIVLAIGLCFSATRNWAIYGIIAMLIAFIPAHIYMIQLGHFKIGGFQMTPMIGWVRLLILQPLLMAWAWYLKNV